MAGLPFLDPHFHIWNVARADDPADQLHDPDILFAPADDPDYTRSRYEAEFATAAPAAGFVHSGGVYVEAMSVCFPAMSAEELNARCVREATWAAQRLGPKEGSDTRYVVVASACLEAPNAAETLAQIAAAPAPSAARVVGIRQIVNKDPSWPRNGGRPDFLQDAAWRAGFALLAEHGLSFDLQCNPSQFASAAEFLKGHPSTPVILNHLGCFTVADLGGTVTDTSTEEEKAAAEAKAAAAWEGMAALAALPQVRVKLSMLCYTDKDWDAAGSVGRARVFAAVKRVLDLFGVDRCFFASNFPVDIKDGWPASRLLPAFTEIVREHFPADQVQGAMEKLFARNVQECYFRE